MRCFPVSTRLNHVAYHDAACSAPVEFAQIQNRLFAWSGSRSIPRQRCTCWLGKRMSFLADFFEPRLAQSHTTVIIPLYKRVVFVGLLNCSEFSSRLSKVTQALYSITGIQFRVGGRGLDKRWSLGSVCISRCSSVRERRLRSFAQFGCQFIDAAHIVLPQRLASYSLSMRIGLERMPPLFQTAQS